MNKNHFKHNFICKKYRENKVLKCFIPASKYFNFGTIWRETYTRSLRLQINYCIVYSTLDFFIFFIFKWSKFLYEGRG